MNLLNSKFKNTIIIRSKKILYKLFLQKFIVWNDKKLNYQGYDSFMNSMYPAEKLMFSNHLKITSFRKKMQDSLF